MYPTLLPARVYLLKQPRLSEDGNVVLTIDKDTIGLTAEGEPLSEISITEMEEPPAPPADCEVIGLTYNLDPMALFLSCP